MFEKREKWTVLTLLEWSTNYLLEKGVEAPRLNVERLLGKVLNFNRIEIYLHFDRLLDAAELADFKILLLRRAAREPLQYILGETEFFSLSFKVSPGVLIPRPETEILVERAIALGSVCSENLEILDVGTGSGIIAIILARQLPAAQVTAVDISAQALQVARANARELHVGSRIRFQHLDILLPEATKFFHKRFDLVVSNPPYVRRSDAPALDPEVRDYEPEEALFVDDPLLFYRTLATMAKQILSPAGYLLCEIADGMESSVCWLFESAGLVAVEAVSDLSGRMRVVSGKMAQK